MSHDRERQAADPAGLHHLTLDTGDLRWSPRSEVADEVVALVAAHIAAARRRGPAPIPGQPGYTARARARGRVLGLTVRGPAGQPLIGMAVAPDRPQALAAPWALPAALVARVPPLDPSDAPVCLVWLLVGLATVPEAAHWLGDYERCTAWAWIEQINRRNRSR